MEIERTPTGQFVKGASGNPAGRPRTDQAIRDLARARTDEVVHILFAIANDPMASDAARVQACNSLMDRAWGRPVQTNQNLNVTGESYYDFLMKIAEEEDRRNKKTVEPDSTDDLLA